MSESNLDNRFMEFRLGGKLLDLEKYKVATVKAA